jgi:hypothetical protein
VIASNGVWNWAKRAVSSPNSGRPTSHAQTVVAAEVDVLDRLQGGIRGDALQTDIALEAQTEQRSHNRVAGTIGHPKDVAVMLDRSGRIDAENVFDRDRGRDRLRQTIDGRSKH